MGSGLLFSGRCKLFAYPLIVGIFVVLSLLVHSTPARAAVGINQQINFQGRLLNGQGAVVPDGTYNIEFKIYQDGDGLTAGDTTGAPAGSLKWTEDYLNNTGNGVLVKNGYLSVQLGSVNPFGSNVDWNQSTLWLSMNIATTAPTCTPFSSCTPDGEMTPMKRLSANAYSLNSGLLGGLSSAQFIQSTTTPQSANIAIQSAATGSIAALIQGASGQTADVLDIKANGVATPLLSVSNTGATQLQPTSDSGLAFNVKSSLGNNTLSVDTANGRVGIGLGANAVPTLANAGLEVKGALRLSGTTTTDNFTTPLGTTLTTKINIPLYDPGAFNQVLALGLPSAASSTARAILVADARASAHQASIGVLSPNEGQIFGLSYDGSNTVGALKNSAASVALQGNTLNILTATNSAGAARVGIGNANTTYALDVTGDINTSGVYRVGGTNVGASTTCSGGTYLQNAVVVGGITTGGSCVAASNGVTTIGAIDSQTKAANGAVIVGTTLYMQTADASNPGLVSTAAQTFAGTKTFNGGVNIAAGQAVQFNGVNTLTSGSLVFSNAATNTITSAASQSLSLNGLNGFSVQTNSVTRATYDTANNLYFGPGATSGTPGSFTAQASGSNVSGTAGGILNLQGGNATVGNANGGNLNLSGGTGFGTGVNGLVVLSTPTFSTVSNDANCYTSGALVASSCTITAASVNGASAILVGFSTSGQSATLPSPTITTAGRVVYITAANGSSDFTLVVNGGGTGNTIAMRQNTTATMIWNGAAWTAAGASSSTTLQSAYDNTLQSAGGAELIVSKTSNTNGLTIRDSSVNPVNGTLLSVQTASAAVLLSVNSNVTEYSTDSGAETAGASSSTFPASTWSAVGSATVSRYTTAGSFIPTGQGSVSTTTTVAANDGVKDTLTGALVANTHYNVSFTARLASGTFTDMNVYYSVDGTTASVVCTASQAIATSVQTKINCAFAAPASGITASNAILIRQTGSGTARTFYVDNLSVTIAADYNYATDGSVDDNTNFVTNWTAVSGATVTRSTTVGNDASDSAQVVTTGAGQGARNKLAINPLQNTLYRVTAYAASTTSGFSTFTARYSRDGGTNFVGCADYNTQTISSSVISFTKVTCYITTDGTAASSPYVYFTQTDATGRTFYVDTFSMTLSSNTTPNVQIGGGINGGPTTLFTLDKGASPPIASNNDALLGSMYYDTTLGKLQCYEADGWGACGSSPDNIVTISPEYTNAVLHGTGVGTMTSDICSGSLHLNDGTSGQPTICGSNETYNFYKWTSPQASAQTYSIYVTYQLPTTFKTFASGQTSLMGRTDSASATAQYSIYRNDSVTGLTQCGTTVAVSTGVQTSWKTGIAAGAADPSTCSFVAGNSIVFKIDVIASTNANAYVGNLNFTFSNK